MTDQAYSTASKTDHENLGLVLALLLGGGLLIAALFWAITCQYRLIYFSAFVPGLAAFALMCYMVWQGRVRGRLFSLILGLVLSVVIYGSYQVMSYFTFRRVAVATYQTESGNTLTADEADRKLDQILQEQVGTSGFLGYVRYKLNAGMTISSTNPLMGPANYVTGTSVLFYWLYDAAIILGGALTGAWWANDRAFCEHCHRYYGRIKSSNGDMGLQKIGWLDQRSADEFKRLLGLGHFEQAGTLLNVKASKQRGMDIKIERCPACNTTPVLLSAYGARSFTSSRQALQFRQVMSADDYDKLTAFATLEPHKRKLSTTNEWAIGITFIVLFLAGLMFAFGALQTSFKF